MRRAAKIDANHTQVVQALRSIPDCCVYSTAAVGNGFPDLAVGYKGKTYLMELKDGEKAKSKRQLTEAEVRFFRIWTGHAEIVESVDDALKVIGVKT